MNPDFFDFYSRHYGDRWPLLLEAFLEKTNSIKLQFSDSLEPYFLDEASQFAAQCLEVEPGMSVLDMCAAPGGKSLVLASTLAGEGTLQCNDRSPERRIRLQHALENTLPADWRSIIKVTGYDASRFGLHCKESYDRILLDAPCSSERHVVQSPKHLAQWSEKRTKRLSIEQGSLLASAVDALSVGGVVVYSTCALSPLENDAVVQKIMKKRKGKIRLMEISLGFEGAERTEFGVHILPDRCKGRGPIFCAKLEKID
ncbi:MAG TPA: RsmB/NOP family class I SAM-dependent RNA methyltransferase [Fibrobacter sp.]|nr:RsmB/NOP family class I SAM-dependent RNA methyltransferase [Fibrobacter sp.]